MIVRTAIELTDRGLIATRVAARGVVGDMRVMERLERRHACPPAGRPAGHFVDRSHSGELT